MFKSSHGWCLVNTKLHGQHYYRDARLYATQLANNFKQHRKWIHCPKCIGGNMYQELDGEYTCLQCGCSYHPEMAENIPHEFDLAVSH